MMDSELSLAAEVAKYVKEIEDLRRKNEVLEGDKKRAAELGMQFVKENKSLAQKFEISRKETATEIEVCVILIYGIMHGKREGVVVGLTYD